MTLYKADDTTVAPRLPLDIIFTTNYLEVFRITSNGEVILQGSVYDAARSFWDAVIAIPPPGWGVKIETEAT